MDFSSLRDKLLDSTLVLGLISTLLYYTASDLIEFGFRGILMSFLSFTLLIWILMIIGFYFLLKKVVIRKNPILIFILFIIFIFLSSAIIDRVVSYDTKKSYKILMKCFENKKECNSNYSIQEVKYIENDKVNKISGFILKSSKSMLVLLTNNSLIKLPKKNIISVKIEIEDFKKLLEK